MDAKQPVSHRFQRLALPRQPPLPAPGRRARRRSEEDTPIFDQLLKEWQAGTLRPTVSWPSDDPGKIRAGAAVGTDDGRPSPRNRDKEPDREPVRHSPAHPDR